MDVNSGFILITKRWTADTYIYRAWRLQLIMSGWAWFRQDLKSFLQEDYQIKTTWGNILKYFSPKVSLLPITSAVWLLMWIVMSLKSEPDLLTANQEATVWKIKLKSRRISRLQHIKSKWKFQVISKILNNQQN